MDPLTLTIVLSLFNLYINITSQKFSSTPFHLLFVIYIVDLPVVRPRSYRIIYYFDTPALGIRHQYFDCVTAPTLFRISYGIINRGLNLFFFPNLNNSLVGDTFKNTQSPIDNSKSHLLLFV